MLFAYFPRTALADVTVLPSPVDPVAPATAPAVVRHSPLNRPLAAWVLGAAAACAGLAAPSAGASTLLTATQGSGNLVVFDAAAGTGGWVGALDGFVHPDTGDALPLVSVVLFQWDAALQSLTGRFEFTAANDLASSLSGLLSGSATSADILDLGGQFSLDYSIQDASGLFAGSTGFGLAFVDFNPASAAADNYSESGLFVTSRAVPAPGSLPLALTALLGLAWARQRRPAGQLPPAVPAHLAP